MSTIEVGLAELGLLDDVRAGCAETGMSLAAFLREKLGRAGKVSGFSENDAAVIKQIHEKLATMSWGEYAEECARTLQDYPWDDLSLEEAREFW